MVGNAISKTPRRVHGVIDITFISEVESNHLSHLHHSFFPSPVSRYFSKYVVFSLSTCISVYFCFHGK